MKAYPEIPGSGRAPLGKPCIAFVKYDGNNLRWEWSAKRGWYKSGTRTQLFDRSHPIYGEAVTLFSFISPAIVDRATKIKRGLQRMVVFTEFFGPNTFAGNHVNEPKELRLFDVALEGKDLMRPRDFVNDFGDLPCAAQVVYEGNLNRQFIDDVREGKFPVNEGVVAKGDDFMVKIKTNAYMQRLITLYGASWRNYWE